MSSAPLGHTDHDLFQSSDWDLGHIYRYKVNIAIVLQYFMQISNLFRRKMLVLVVFSVGKTFVSKSGKIIWLNWNCAVIFCLLPFDTNYSFHCYNRWQPCFVGFLEIFFVRNEKVKMFDVLLKYWKAVRYENWSLILFFIVLQNGYAVYSYHLTVRDTRSRWRLMPVSKSPYWAIRKLGE